MIRNYICLSLVAAVTGTACSVMPEQSPLYTQNQAPSYAQPVNASYQTAQSRAADQDCRRQETNRELIGGAVGGAAGAYAGKKLIGGTKGAVAGAALGGIAGYGIGDISTNCAPSYAPAAQSSASYQSAPRYSPTPASSAPISCPIGTKPHASSGTCLLDNPYASLESATFTGIQTRTIQRAEIPIRSTNIISASATPTAPSPYRSADVTGQSRPENYSGNYSEHISGNYRVVHGDTVYSLARKLCVPTTAIQSYNGLDANYGIQIGQSLNLPTSQC